MVDNNMPTNDRNAIELTMMSDAVIDYEKEHYPIVKPTVVLALLSNSDKLDLIAKLSNSIVCSPLLNYHLDCKGKRIIMKS